MEVLHQMSKAFITVHPDVLETECGVNRHVLELSKAALPKAARNQTSQRPPIPRLKFTRANEDGAGDGGGGKHDRRQWAQPARAGIHAAIAKEHVQHQAPTSSRQVRRTAGRARRLWF